MANKRVTDLPQAEKMLDGDILHIIQNGIDKQIPANKVGGDGIKQADTVAEAEQMIASGELEEGDVVLVKNDNNGVPSPSDLNNKISKVTDFQISNKSILSIINESGSAFGSVGVVNCPDAPNDGEFAVFWFGSSNRIKVFCVAFSGANTPIYYRALFQNYWLTNWSNNTFSSHQYSPYFHSNHACTMTFSSSTNVSAVFFSAMQEPPQITYSNVDGLSVYRIYAPSITQINVGITVIHDSPTDPVFT